MLRSLLDVNRDTCGLKKEMFCQSNRHQHNIMSIKEMHANVQMLHDFFIKTLNQYH